MKSYSIYHMSIKHNSATIQLIMVPEAIKNSNNSKNYEIGFMSGSENNFREITCKW